MKDGCSLLEDDPCDVASKSLVVYCCTICWKHIKMLCISPCIAPKVVTQEQYNNHMRIRSYNCHRLLSRVLSKGRRRRKNLVFNCVFDSLSCVSCHCYWALLSSRGITEIRKVTLEDFWLGRHHTLWVWRLCTFCFYCLLLIWSCLMCIYHTASSFIFWVWLY